MMRHAKLCSESRKVFLHVCCAATGFVRSFCLYSSLSFCFFVHSRASTLQCQDGSPAGEVGFVGSCLLNLKQFFSDVLCWTSSSNLQTPTHSKQRAAALQKVGQPFKLKRWQMLLWTVQTNVFKNGHKGSEDKKRLRAANNVSTLPLRNRCTIFRHLAAFN